MYDRISRGHTGSLETHNFLFLLILVQFYYTSAFLPAVLAFHIYRRKKGLAVSFHPDRVNIYIHTHMFYVLVYDVVLFVVFVPSSAASVFSLDFS